MKTEWWIGLRNSFLGSARFQRWAIRFPLTRLIARRHARRLFDLVAGFCYSQTLLACVQLGLFDKLATSPPMTLSELATFTGLSHASIERLVRAAIPLKLLTMLTGDRVTLGTAGAALAGNPGVGAMIAHHPRLYADLADPVALLRQGGGGGALAGFWNYTPDRDSADVIGYSTLMAVSQPLVATQLLDAYDFGQHRRLLDVGGGEGAFLTEVAKRVPKLALGLWDLPAVADRARCRLGDRATIHAGDFFAAPLPRGYDLVTLVRILHDHDDEPALALLRTIRASLHRGARLMIGEPMLAARGTGAMGATYFGMYLLAMGSGRARSPREIGALLKAAGFVRWRHLPTAMPLTVSIVVADV